MHYHPQSNGLVERQNSTIKSALAKILNENPQEWPYVIQGVLFAHRVRRHKSTKFLPFFMLYNREPTLPIFFFMDFILEENAHGLALKFSQSHGNLENYKHGTVK